MDIVLKRAYAAPATDDGYRVLVDRLWPRGIKKEALALDGWCKDIAPSTELRQWFAHEPAKFEQFTMRYKAELEASNIPTQLLERAKDSSKLSLIYAAKDPQINHAVVLCDYLKQL